MNKGNTNSEPKQIRFWFADQNCVEYLIECAVTVRNYPAEPENGIEWPYSETEVEILRAENEAGFSIDPLSGFTQAELNDIEYQAAQHSEYGGSVGFFAEELEAARKYYYGCIDADEEAERELDAAKIRYEAAISATKSAFKEKRRIEKIQQIKEVAA
jgi:hypothetical protein